MREVKPPDDPQFEWQPVTRPHFQFCPHSFLRAHFRMGNALSVLESRIALWSTRVEAKRTECDERDVREVESIFTVIERVLEKADEIPDVETIVDLLELPMSRLFNIMVMRSKGGVGAMRGFAREDEKAFVPSYLRDRYESGMKVASPNWSRTRVQALGRHWRCML